MKQRYRLGIDVGGTFTDLVLYDEVDGTTTTGKVPTVPSDPSIGILDGIRELGIDLADVSNVTHGTTTATNTLIERNGAHTGYITTKGFRDILEIRRGNREEIYSVQWVPPPPLVPRRHRLEVEERVLWDGEVLAPVNERDVDDVISTLAARDIESVAICFLNSYEHPDHEEFVRQKVEAALPGVFVTTSSEISEEFREFERASTVAANAYVGPRVAKYVRNLGERLSEAGLQSEVTIMQSNGGVCSLDRAAQMPIKLARSGPAGGAKALERLSSLLGIGNLVGLDTGGTSADVALIVGGKARMASPLTVEWGLPLLFPSVDIVSIGAGGGSIAWIDHGGALHMGPQSAGSVPGPACYDRGGELPTSTDAQVVLGRIRPELFLGGAMEIRSDLARAAIETHVAQKLGMNVTDAAEGMLKVLDTVMLEAIRLLTIQKGYDPRDFTLVAYGGSGPLNVVTLARELGMQRAVVPVAAGVLSAWGLLTVDMVQDRSRTMLRRRRALSLETLSSTLRGMRDDILASFAREGISAPQVEFEYLLDLQYYGQTFSLPVPLRGIDLGPSDDGGGDASIRAADGGILSVAIDVATMAGDVVVTPESLDRCQDVFHEEHRREYGHADDDQEVQVVNARVFGRCAVPKPTSARVPAASTSTTEPAYGYSAVQFDGNSVSTALYSRDQLRPGTSFSGPAMVYEAFTTTAVPPGARVDVDEFGNMIIATTE